ncbi:MAG TPA: transposase [Candidatus Acidoferrales bacterium]|nr:transposase [Candidatus Acidoferrales bacterium]
MPRANRHFFPGYVWHLTHRCHQKQFLLKFARDRQRYLYWVFEAKKRFGLCVLNYMVTSNHVHLLVKDTGGDVIAESMQLIAGRTAQEYNQRKSRHGAFWEDRYHATAVEADEHLCRCLVYIDLNMVRAGVVNHPSKWVHSGYREIQKPPKRYAIIDLRELTALSGFADTQAFQTAHRQWVQRTLERGLGAREDRWSESIAVGSLSFVENVKRALGHRAAHRAVEQRHGAYALRDQSEPYSGNLGSESEPLSVENTVFWDDNAETTGR